MNARTPWMRVAGVTTLFLSGLAFFSAGCDSDDDYGRRGGGPRDYLGCEQATTCGTCTPIAGCGWCQTPTGEGMCASDPNQCASVPSFSWAWDPSGCRVAADAGLSDAGVTLPLTDGAAPVLVDASPAGDASDAHATDAATVPAP